MDLPQAIARLINREDLTGPEMTEVMRTIMSGEATPAQIGGFLVGLRIKGETVPEIVAAAGVMRELATPVPVSDVRYLVDTCGTGGDGRGLFNVSTAVAFVVAAAGGRVAKHGNRSVSSRSGSADVLETAGVRLDLAPDAVARCIDELGVGFLFAPAHHGAMRHAIGPRREMGVRTLFNLLGPLTNPARAPNQLMGVFDSRWVEPLAEVLGALGSRHVMVVHAEDGLDEISIEAPTRVAELRDGEVINRVLTPEDFGLPRQSLASVEIGSPDESLALMREVFGGAVGPARDLVLVNAAAALYVAGRAPDLKAGVALAEVALDSGEAGRRLDALARRSLELAA
jgi:anthranilate phosphoribosyltransferase